jgi:hypothetical protein
VSVILFVEGDLIHCITHDLIHFYQDETLKTLAKKTGESFGDLHRYLSTQLWLEGGAEIGSWKICLEEYPQSYLRLGYIGASYLFNLGVLGFPLDYDTLSFPYKIPVEVKTYTTKFLALCPETMLRIPEKARKQLVDIKHGRSLGGPKPCSMYSLGVRCLGRMMKSKSVSLKSVINTPPSPKMLRWLYHSSSRLLRLYKILTGFWLRFC